MRAARWLFLAAALMATSGLAIRLVPVSAGPNPDHIHASNVDAAAEPIGEGADFAGGVLFRERMDLQPQAVTETALPPAPIRPERPRLVGIASQNGEPVVWLQTGSRPAMALLLGEAISGWEVVDITDTEVTVAFERDEVRLRLFGDGN